jgi:hypothetical protein
MEKYKITQSNNQVRSRSYLLFRKIYSDCSNVDGVFGTSRLYLAREIYKYMVAEKFRFDFLSFAHISMNQPVYYAFLKMDELNSSYACPICYSVGCESYDEQKSNNIDIKIGDDLVPFIELSHTSPVIEDNSKTYGMYNTLSVRQPVNNARTVCWTKEHDTDLSNFCYENTFYKRYILLMHMRFFTGHPHIHKIKRSVYIEQCFMSWMPTRVKYWEWTIAAAILKHLSIIRETAYMKTSNKVFHNTQCEMVKPFDILYYVSGWLNSLISEYVIVLSSEMIPDRDYTMYGPTKAPSNKKEIGEIIKMLERIEFRMENADLEAVERYYNRELETVHSIVTEMLIIDTEGNITCAITNDHAKLHLLKSETSSKNITKNEVMRIFKRLGIFTSNIIALKKLMVGHDRRESDEIVMHNHVTEKMFVMVYCEDISKLPTVSPFVEKVNLQVFLTDLVPFHLSQVLLCAPNLVSLMLIKNPSKKTIKWFVKNHHISNVYSKILYSYSTDLKMAFPMTKDKRRKRLYGFSEAYKLIINTICDNDSKVMDFQDRILNESDMAKMFKQSVNKFNTSYKSKPSILSFIYKEKENTGFNDNTDVQSNNVQDEKNVIREYRDIRSTLKKSTKRTNNGRVVNRDLLHGKQKDEELLLKDSSLRLRKKKRKKRRPNLVYKRVN